MNTIVYAVAPKPPSASHKRLRLPNMSPAKIQSPNTSPASTIRIVIARRARARRKAKPNPVMR